MKKLNNFILFPLILGTTCLVCGGVVSAINYAVSGKIAENSSGKNNQKCFCRKQRS